MTRRAKIFIAGSCAILLIVIVGVVLYFSTIKEYRATLDGIQITGVDLSQIPDGVYRGSSDAILVSAEVAVTVENYRIVHIELKHNHGRGKEAEIITDMVIDAQSLAVDMISGSTASSKVILGAIQDALTKQ